MRLQDRVKPYHLQNLKMRQATFICEPPSGIDLKKKVLIVAPAGSGKSRFCNTYFDPRTENAVAETNFHLTKYNCLPPAFFLHENPLQEAFDDVFEAIFECVGRWHRLVYFLKHQLKQVFSHDDTYEDLLNEPTSKEALNSDNTFARRNVHLPTRWVVNRLKKSSILQDGFTLNDCNQNREALVREIFSEPSEFLEGMANHDMQLTSGMIPHHVDTLLKASLINPDIGFTLEVFAKNFTKDDKTDWTLKFEQQQPTRLSESHRKYATQFEFLPVLSQNQNDYYLFELSDTQEMEVCMVVMSVILNFIGDSVSNRIFLFDEPDAKVDPASTQELMRFVDLFSESRGVFIATHSLPLLSQCMKDPLFDILSFEFNGSETKISKITDNPYELRRTITRLTDGVNFVSANESVVQSFLDSAPEQNFIFSEGKSDIGIFKYSQQKIIEDELFSDNIREFLERTIFLNFNTDEGDYQRGGAGNLSWLLRMSFHDNALMAKNQRVFGIFDSDKSGLVEASKVYQDFHNRPNSGELIQYEERPVYYYNFHVPADIKPNEFALTKGPALEHLFYHKRAEAKLTFNSLEPSSGTKKGLLDKVSACYEKTNDKAEKESIFRELAIMYEKLRSVC